MKAIIFLFLLKNQPDTNIHLFERRMFPEMITDTETYKVNNYLKKGDTLFVHHWPNTYMMDTAAVRRIINRQDSARKAEKLKNDMSVK